MQGHINSIVKEVHGGRPSWSVNIINEGYIDNQLYVGGKVRLVPVGDMNPNRLKRLWARLRWFVT